MITEKDGILTLFVSLIVALIQLKLVLANYEMNYIKQTDDVKIKIIEAVITAYTSLPELTDSTPFITASGATTRDGIIACPRKYPFGTLFVVEGKLYDCQDRMNIRYEGREKEHFDIWFPSYGGAINYGVHKKPIIRYIVLY